MLILIDALILMAGQSEDSSVEKAQGPPNQLPGSIFRFRDRSRITPGTQSLLNCKLTSSNSALL